MSCLAPTTPNSFSLNAQPSGCLVFPSSAAHYLPPSVSLALSRWDDKTETSWPGPIRDAHNPEYYLLARAARTSSCFFWSDRNRTENGSRRVGTGNSYRTQLIRLLNVAALLLLLFFVLLLLAPTANSSPRVFWQISINVLLSHKSINYLFSATKKKIYKYFNNLRFLFSLWNFRQTRRKTRNRAKEQTKQNKRREEKKRQEKLLLLIDRRPLWPAASCTWVAAGN